MSNDVNDIFNIKINIGITEYEPLELRVIQEVNDEGNLILICKLNDDSLFAKLERDIKGNWNQLSGNVDERTIRNIYKAIEMHDLSRVQVIRNNDRV